jgi:murein DD-endopeptidase MepM/ murein hydrolase activator NlpD
MNQADKQVQKERHKRLHQAQNKSAFHRAMEGLFKFVHSSFQSLRSLIKWIIRVPSKKMHRFTHPLEKLPAPKRLNSQVAIWSIALLFLTSINNGHAMGQAAYWDDESAELALSYEIQNHLELDIASLPFADDSGYILKGMPTGGETLYDQSREGNTSHTVSTGESLSLIAYKYGISMQSIYYANPGLQSSKYIQVSQALTIPPASGLYTEITEEDTLLTLLEAHDGDLEETLSFNSLTENSELIVGQELFIVDGHPAQPEVEEQELIVYEDNTTIPDLKIDQPDSSDSSQNTDDIIFVPTDPENTYYDLPVSAEGWVRPTIGGITQGYRAGHYAFDVADRSRPDIVAAASGTITKAYFGGWGNGYGNHIIIDHGNGYETLYAHADLLYVEVGQQVIQGQSIAMMGNTGQVYGVTGIHLHFVLTYEGQKINPNVMGVW